MLLKHMSIVVSNQYEHNKQICPTMALVLHIHFGIDFSNRHTHIHIYIYTHTCVSMKVHWGLEAITLEINLTGPVYCAYNEDFVSDACACIAKLISYPSGLSTRCRTFPKSKSKGPSGPERPTTGHPKGPQEPTWIRRAPRRHPCFSCRVICNCARRPQTS
jgi:hypothetical protein